MVSIVECWDPQIASSAAGLNFRLLYLAATVMHLHLIRLFADCQAWRCRRRSEQFPGSSVENFYQMKLAVTCGVRTQPWRAIPPYQKFIRSVSSRPIELRVAMKPCDKFSSHTKTILVNGLTGWMLGNS